MAITQVANPSSVPSAVADYEAQNAHISAFNNIVNNQPFILTNSGGTGLPAIKLGTYIQFGGNLYVVDTEDYAITGTPVDGNNYIRISGSTTLTAEWIQDISSYVWNEVYGYKYTGSYALLPYLVVKDGAEYAKYTNFPVYPSFTDQDLKTTDSPTFASVNTGQGANKLYAMNQNVQTTSVVAFKESSSFRKSIAIINRTSLTEGSVIVADIATAYGSGITSIPKMLNANGFIKTSTSNLYLIVWVSIVAVLGNNAITIGAIDTSTNAFSTIDILYNSTTEYICYINF